MGQEQKRISLSLIPNKRANLKQLTNTNRVSEVGNNPAYSNFLFGFAFSKIGDYKKFVNEINLP